MSGPIGPNTVTGATDDRAKGDCLRTASRGRTDSTVGASTPSPRAIGRRLFALSGLLVASCSGDEVEPPSGDRPAPTPPTDDISISLQDELRHLATLGYADYAEEDDSEFPGSAVVYLDPARTSPGYGLYASQPHGLAALIDAEGNELRVWRSGPKTTMARAILLEAGDLVAVCKDDPSGSLSSEFLLRLGWDGEVRWRLDIRAHHDVQELADGRLAVLSVRYEVVPTIHETIPLRDDVIVVVSAEGEVLEEYSVWEMISSSPEWAQRMVQRYLRRHSKALADVANGNQGAGSPFIDLFHTNSLQILGPHELADENSLYAPTNLLLSLAQQNTIAIFDTREGKPLWLFGQDEFRGQHEARMLANGNVLCFDNGTRGRGYSRVVEVDPPTSTIVWEYKARPPENFYSPTRGTSQALPGGNVLITNSDRGEAFEIDRDGELVWRFLNPYTNSRGVRGGFRMLRYPPALVEPLLQGR